MVALSRQSNAPSAVPLPSGPAEVQRHHRSLKTDFGDPTSPVVATEFVGTSISPYFPP